MSFSKSSNCTRPNLGSLKSSLSQINPKLNSKPYDYLYIFISSFIYFFSYLRTQLSNFIIQEIVAGKKVKGNVCIPAKWLISAGASPGFCSMKLIGDLYSPLYGGGGGYATTPPIKTKSGQEFFYLSLMHDRYYAIYVRCQYSFKIVLVESYITTVFLVFTLLSIGCEKNRQLCHSIFRNIVVAVSLTAVADLSGCQRLLQAKN